MNDRNDKNRKKNDNNRKKNKNDNNRKNKNNNQRQAYAGRFHTACAVLAWVTVAFVVIRARATAFCGVIRPALKRPALPDESAEIRERMK